MHDDDSRSDLLAALVAAAGWGTVLLSVALFALHWRASNEPGAGRFAVLHLSAWLLCGAGVAVFVGAQIRLVARRSWPHLALSWGICLALLVVSVSLSPILLLLMV